MPLRDYLKKIFWTLSLPFFPHLRNLWRKFGYAPYPARQEFHFGWLDPNLKVENFKNFLLTKGFKKNWLAWIDEGEILSLRLKENFKYQYHLRLFKDREIRGHHELTPEYSPLGHLRDVETTSGEEYFKPLLRDWLGKKDNLK